MPRYIIVISVKREECVILEATDEDDARRKAEKERELDNPKLGSEEVLGMDVREVKPWA